jgi:chromate transporter
VELAWLFLKLGAIAFGGPPAHIAMMEDEVVTRRGWLRREEFLDFLGAANVIPGPTSTELALHVGRIRAGWLWLSVVPRLRQSRLTGAALDGVNVAALALMAVVTYQLARTAFVDWPTAALGMLSLWLLLRYRLNSAWLVVGGAITGALASTLHLG